MSILRQGTTAVIQIGPFLSTANAQTESTNLTISSAIILLSKNGSSYVAKGAVGGGTYSGAAFYAADLSTADTGTVGRLDVYIANSSALPVWHTFDVWSQTAYDALVAGTGNLTVLSEASAILKNSSHGNEALLTILSSIKAETTAIHVETSALSVLTSSIKTETSAIHTETSALSVLTSSIKTETSAIHTETTAIKAVIENSSHGNAALLTILSSIKGETTAIHAETTALSVLTSSIKTETSVIHGETTAIKAVLENSSHGNAALLVVLSSIKAETTAIHAESTAQSTILANSSHGNAGILASISSAKTDILGASGTAIDLSKIAGPTFSTVTDSLEALRDRGDAAWITASGFSTLTIGQIPTVAQISTGVHDSIMEGTITHKDAVKIELAVLAGESTGGGSTIITFKGQTTTVNRVVANVDANGNRTAVALTTAG